jgi:uncharacterized membrane protein YphA (DoxX/SURF4 family)
MELFASTNTYGELLLRIATGIFFVCSGYHKLFNPERHEALKQTLISLNVPCVGFNQWWVPTVEFMGGLGVIVGFLFPVAAIGLIIICTVATCTDGLRRIKSWKPIDLADWLDDLLYLPEAIYVLILIALIIDWL